MRKLLIPFLFVALALPTSINADARVNCDKPRHMLGQGMRKHYSSVCNKIKNRKDKKSISLRDFGEAVNKISSIQCLADKNTFKTQEEFTEAIQSTFKHYKIPLKYSSNQLIINAALEVSSYCSEFITPTEIDNIILKYFKQQ